MERAPRSRGDVAARLDDPGGWRLRLHAAVVGVAERGVEWVILHWVLLCNVALGIVLLGAYATPALEALGLAELARTIHIAYLPLCPQRPEHSYFPFGYQTALEHREIAMFAAQLAGGLVYARARDRLRGIPWWLMLALSLPIAWDGFSQMFGLRDSTWFLRTLTGALFSLALVFWLYPRVERWLPLPPAPVDRRPAAGAASG